MSGPTPFDKAGIPLFTEQSPGIVQLADLLDYINEMRDLYYETQEALQEAQSYHYYSSVKEYGAIGDGLNDDTQAIQNCLNEASLKGLNVLFPYGVYMISTRIDIPSNIIIYGFNSTVKLKSYVSASNKPDLFNINGKTNISIFNLNFDGNNPQQTQIDTNVYRSILIQDSSDINIQYCKFKDVQHQSIQVAGKIAGNPLSTGVSNLFVDKCKFENVWCALQVTESQSNNIIFSNNKVKNTWEHGFTTYPGVNSVKVINNFFENLGLRALPTYNTFNAGCGIRIFETFNSVVTGNEIVNPNYCGIRITTNNPITNQKSDYSVVSQNIVRGGLRNGATGSGIIIGEQNKTSDIIVQNNFIENFIAYNFAEGIKILGDGCIINANKIKTIKQSGITVNGNENIISSNVLIDTGLYGVVLGGTIASDHCVVSNNIIKTEKQSVSISRGIYLQSNATNVKNSNNVFIGVLNEYFNASSSALFNDGFYRNTSIPTGGTYKRGDIVYKTDIFQGAPKGWTCVSSGTFGTSTVNATTVINTNVIIIDGSFPFKVNEFITIAGILGTKKILKIENLNLTLDSNVDQSLTGAVSYVAPTFVSNGNL